MQGLKDELAARGVKVSHNAVCLFLRREGLSLKKFLFALEQGHAAIARRRNRRESIQPYLDPRHLEFIDVDQDHMAPIRDSRAILMQLHSLSRVRAC